MSGAVPNIHIIGSGFVSGDVFLPPPRYLYFVFFLFHQEHLIRIITQALFYSPDDLILFFVVYSHLWLYCDYSNIRRDFSNVLRNMRTQSKNSGFNDHVMWSHWVSLQPYVSLQYLTIYIGAAFLCCPILLWRQH
jgi:hypothetical protein